MALATVKVIVAAAAVLTAPRSAASAAATTDVKCSIDGATQVHEITAPGASIKVLCMQKGGDSPYSGGKPSICADPKCEEADKAGTKLTAACPGGTTADANPNGLIVNCPQLPNTAATILLLCGQIKPTSPTGVCAVELKVLPPPPQGPQVCAAAGTTTTLKIQGEKGETRFGCPAEGLSALNPRATEKVFKEDCTAEEDLKDLKFTAGTPYNTLAATKKPRTRKLCYVCKEAAGNKSPEKGCRVFIEVSGGPRLLGRTTLSFAVPFVLAVLPLT